MVMAANPVQTRQAATRRRTAAAQLTAARDEQVETAETTEERAEGEPLVRWGHVAVPVPVGVHVPTPHLPHLPSSARNAAKRTAFGLGVVRANLPKPRQLVYYGALGGLAAVGAIEWPVAAAIGAGVWVASRTGWRRPARPGEAPAEAGHPGEEARQGEAPAEAPARSRELARRATTSPAKQTGTMRSTRTR
jgi:hypothetical protein